MLRALSFWVAVAMQTNLNFDSLMLFGKRKANKLCKDCMTIQAPNAIQIALNIVYCDHLQMILLNTTQQD